MREEPEPYVDLYALVKECAATQDLESEECIIALELKASLNGKSAYELSDLVEKVNYVCRKALVESRMSAAQFWTKYR